MIPVLLDVQGKAVLIVGAGQVGLRKAQAFKAEGAVVTLWDRETAPPINTAPAEVQQQLAAFNLLVLATDDSTYNDWLAAHARQLGLWCNRADSGGAGDLQTMATLRRGPLTISVGTEGVAPGLSKALKHALDQRLPKDLDQAMENLAALRRAMVDAEGPDRTDGAKALQQAIDELVAYVTDKWPTIDL